MESVWPIGMRFLSAQRDRAIRLDCRWEDGPETLYVWCGDDGDQQVTKEELRTLAKGGRVSKKRPRKGKDHDERSIIDERCSGAGFSVTWQCPPSHGLHGTVTGVAVVKCELGKHAITENFTVNDQRQALPSFFQ